ncbi:YciI family protein [Dyella mobilis]|uniref:YCII-related domain-containing protein n=1 Tax=Dyella mobilis TaxID=1849582 RepID=A0ABS2KCF5_9GAMM|nr:YciI family protein [Dyella mobilis]MBM7128857.1 hypothetical protein [Dyella mobilis]GLQ99188.1 hypothetical protein GCM10007863_36080 [Dyella mobilis]
MKPYLLAIYHPGGDGDAPPPDELEAIMGKVRSVREEMKAADAWIFSGGLEAPSTATVLRANGRGVHATDGPFLETKEYIGGLTIIRAADQDAALAWARKLVQATGLLIEVRPFEPHDACAGMQSAWQEAQTT